jgi:hypothetical protein
MTPIDMVWPHSYAVIFQNISGKRLDLPWLGRHGVILPPNEIIAVLGNPLVQPTHYTHYDGKKSIEMLADMIADGELAVLSIPGGDKEADNTAVPVVDADLQALPGCQVETT